MESFGNAAKSLARNPLGIIALFLVLVYGLACLVAGFTKFEPGERTPLVWFIVVFPVCILVAFYRLVAKHHVKLYAPSDFRNDESFLHPLSPEQNKARITGEVSRTVININDPLDIKKMELELPAKEEAVKVYLLAETLAVRQLESEMGRRISLGGFSYGAVNPPATFDATVIHNASIYCIEVKLVRSLTDSPRILNDTFKEFGRVMDFRRANSFEHYNRGTSFVSTVLMLVVVVDFPIGDFEREKQRINEHFLNRPKDIDFELRVYSFKELKQRFGLC